MHEYRAVREHRLVDGVETKEQQHLLSSSVVASRQGVVAACEAGVHQTRQSTEHTLSLLLSHVACVSRAPERDRGRGKGVPTLREYDGNRTTDLSFLF